MASSESADSMDDLTFFVKDAHLATEVFSDPRSTIRAAQHWDAVSYMSYVADEFDSRLKSHYAEVASQSIRENLVVRDLLTEYLWTSAYNPPIYLLIARTYLRLAYPDLAAGAAYKALLLFDALTDDSDEYHQRALHQYQRGFTQWSKLTAKYTSLSYEEAQTHEDVVTGQLRLQVYELLATSLQQCGCLRSAYLYCTKGLEIASLPSLQKTMEEIRAAAASHYKEEVLSSQHSNALTWPDSGMVRRELYPWNFYEPDRLNDIDALNDMMQAVAPKLEVKATRLPSLAMGTNDDNIAEVVQLGVFAREDLLPGEVVLRETSLLTANNKLLDALCDACSVELPDLGSAESADTVACDECQVVFCSQSCHDLAMEAYHTAVCDRDVESIAKQVPQNGELRDEGSDALYSLLLLRAFALAETQEIHLLRLNEVKYIWGDFNETRSVNATKTLPFSFKYNITLPYHMLEKMDVDIFAAGKYDVWVFNTLYAKFRGTASARLSGLGGRARRGPEVCAVHPMWCLANHSCDPNVSWEWGGEITFRVREQRVEWQGEVKSFRNQPGVKKGEEILNHYTDLDMPVQERREWARGALGGDCMCERCKWEDAQSRVQKE